MYGIGDLIAIPFPVVFERETKQVSLFLFQYPESMLLVLLLLIGVPAILYIVIIRRSKFPGSLE